jgi:hypothetical protein
VDWDAIGAVAELLGALGVIASLIYLAVQIRQNTESVRMASHHGVAEQFQRSNLAALEDPQLAELLIRGLPDASSLSDVDRLRVDLYLLSLFRTYEELYQLHQKGLVDHELWDSREQSMMRWMSYPGVRSWWRDSQVHMFIASFRAYIDGRLPETAALYGAGAVKPPDSSR